jgi:methanogenic corrinoid protein MtbC1
MLRGEAWSGAGFTSFPPRVVSRGPACYEIPLNMTTTSQSTTALAARYLKAQLAGDRAEAVRLLIDEGLHRGVSAADLLLGVIQPAQREIGRLWQENKVSIAQEHLATGISQLALARIYQESPRAPQLGKSVLVACIEGETHEMGARIAADFLEMAGFHVRFLGANVPTDSLLDMIKASPPDLIALSATINFHTDALRSAVERIRSATEGKIPIMVGGHIFEWDPSLRDRLGDVVHGEDAVALVAAAKRALGVQEAA